MGQGLLTKSRQLALTGFLLVVPSACFSHSLFSGVPYPDRSRPVARIETRGGVEFGATTTEGILFLGRTANDGPCRVHYFLGETPMVEDGEIRHLGGVLYLADIDLKHQSVGLLEREATNDDELYAMVHAGGSAPDVNVRLANNDDIEGDVLAWPGGSLPPGSPVFADTADGLKLVGLVSGEVRVVGGSSEGRYLTFAGSDRIREALATPRVHPVAPTVKHRPDDISLLKK